ncbi:MAG TPA: hypothetical protein VMP01_29715 [Pirellulaceae bacterium]|nr:hypothetical protein [Pirellulaceae bacterium]
MIPTWLDRRLLVATLPALLAGVVFKLFLGHRHDYTGHFLAGYGGTLGLTMFALRVLPAERFGSLSTWSLVPLCILCIGLGAITEATIFRLAKFDEVDFCNQSLGAVLAAAAALAYVGPQKPPQRHFHFGLIAAIAFLGAGGCFAFA